MDLGRGSFVASSKSIGLLRNCTPAQVEGAQAGGEGDDEPYSTGEMMTDKYTPGPWHVIRYNHVDGDTWLAIGWTDAEGRKIGPLTEMVGGAVTDTPPCWFPVSRMKYIMGGDEQLIANATLVAAAPELLAACRLASRRFSDQNGEVSEEVWTDNYAAVKALADAIAKATGGAS